MRKAKRNGKLVKGSGVRVPDTAYSWAYKAESVPSRPGEWHYNKHWPTYYLARHHEPTTELSLCATIASSLKIARLLVIPSAKSTLLRSRLYIRPAYLGGASVVTRLHGISARPGFGGIRYMFRLMQVMSHWDEHLRGSTSRAYADRFMHAYLRVGAAQMDLAWWTSYSVDASSARSTIGGLG